MIKKSIKRFNFTNKWESLRILEGLEGHVYNPNLFSELLGGTTTLQTDINGGTTRVQPTPNEYAVRLDIVNNPDPQFVLHADGDAIFTGRVHSLGSVMWNQVLNRLEFWDGTNWIPINT